MARAIAQLKSMASLSPFERITRPRGPFAAEGPSKQTRNSPPGAASTGPGSARRLRGTMPSRRGVAAMASRSSSIFARNSTGRDVPDKDAAAHARAHEGAGAQVLAPLEHQPGDGVHAVAAVPVRL